MGLAIRPRLPHFGDSKPRRGFPISDKPTHPPTHLKQIWKSPTKRLKERGRSSGFKNEQPHLGRGFNSCSEMVGRMPSRSFT